MTRNAMVGVILWRSEAGNSVVIWCDDHADLAYYAPPAGEDRSLAGLEAGDLIEFDLVDEAGTRTVQRPRRLEAGYAPTLPRMLVRSESAAKIGAQRHGNARSSETATVTNAFPHAWRRAG